MYDIYQKLLDKNGLKNADISRETGISNMTLSDWKHGKSVPKADKLQIIAEYFDVSVEYLMTGKEKDADYLLSDENGDLLIEVTHRTRNKEFAERLSAYMNLSDEDRKVVDNMIECLNNKNKE